MKAICARCGCPINVDKESHEVIKTNNNEVWYAHTDREKCDRLFNARMDREGTPEYKQEVSHE